MNTGKMTAKWFQHALDDIGQIDNNLRGPNFNGRMVSFHAQQASEKLLKALIIHQGLHPPYVHDLNALIKIISPQGPLAPFISRLVKFDKLDVWSRYPKENEEDTWTPPDKALAERWYQELIEISQAVAKFLHLSPLS